MLQEVKINYSLLQVCFFLQQDFLYPIHFYGFFSLWHFFMAFVVQELYTGFFIAELYGKESYFETCSVLSSEADNSGIHLLFSIEILLDSSSVNPGLGECKFYVTALGLKCELFWS